MKKKKGVCTYGRIFYGMATVSEKGQIAIPVDLRKDLNIKAGSRLLVLKRKDDAGFTLVKVDVMDKFMDEIREDEAFFSKLKKRR